MEGMQDNPMLAMFRDAVPSFGGGARWPGDETKRSSVHIVTLVDAISEEGEYTYNDGEVRKMLPCHIVHLVYRYDDDDTGLSYEFHGRPVYVPTDDVTPEEFVAIPQNISTFLEIGARRFNGWVTHFHSDPTVPPMKRFEAVKNAINAAHESGSEVLVELFIQRRRGAGDSERIYRDDYIQRVVSTSA